MMTLIVINICWGHTVCQEILTTSLWGKYWYRMCFAMKKQRHKQRQVQGTHPRCPHQHVAESVGVETTFVTTLLSISHYTFILTLLIEKKRWERRMPNSCIFIFRLSFFLHYSLLFSFSCPRFSSSSKIIIIQVHT